MKKDLENLAIHVMSDKGLMPKFSDGVYIQLHGIKKPADPPHGSEDLRRLPFCSIDNDDSLDLDQLTYAECSKDGKATLWVAVADVDALVPKGSPIDQHAMINTTSVYTPAIKFPMLPDKLSTNLTSLNEKEDRVAIVVKATMRSDGEIEGGSITEALVRNHAKLAYPSLGAWFSGKADMPEKIKKVPGLEKTLRCQHAAAQKMKQWRHLYGALTLESPEAEAKMIQEKVILMPPVHNLAMQLIEQFMIAANFVMASHLRAANIPSLRRVVRTPKRWERIVEVAAKLGGHLPAEPNSKALEKFLIKRKKIDSISFPDLSLTIIKLLGRGEYIVETGEDAPTGHFGLALSEYIHSTAPNRRYPDLITQRQYKALIQKRKNPYSLEELQTLAKHCTDQEDVATKVERHLNKSAAAMLLQSRIGETFEGIVTGVGPHGTWARAFDPPVEGKVVHGFDNLDVGDRVTLKLESVDVPLGHINFRRK